MDQAGKREWSTKKQDPAPRGVRRHPSGVWGIRYVCGAGCPHKERVGPIKQDAIRAYHQRRARAKAEPGWCPRVARAQARDRAAVARAQEARRLSFRAYADEYLAWAKLHHRGWRTEPSRVEAMQQVLGYLMLDRLAPAEVERFLDGLLKDRSRSTRNRYRTLLHAMCNRALRHGLIASNPVASVGKFKEPEGRTLYLTAEDEAAIREALRPGLRALFTVSVHTGLRWSEQRALRWADVDFLTGQIAVTRSKSGHSRQVPMNSVVRSACWTWPPLGHAPTTQRRRSFPARMPRRIGSFRGPWNRHAGPSARRAVTLGASRAIHGTATGTPSRAV